MKTIRLRARACVKVLLPFVMAAVCVLCARSQGYVNLNFEDAGTNAIDPNAMFLAWNVGAPGWQHAGVASPFIGHNTVGTGGTASYFLVDSSCTSLSPMMGNYSFALINGHLSPTDPNSQFIMTWIAQSGTIPANAHSFEILATGAPFSVTLNGTDIPMTSLGGNLYGGDVSDFAGQSVPLLIQNDSTQPGTILLLDDLQFGPTPVPEPASITLLAAGLGASIKVAGKRRRKAR
jgi:PEP-CTERM motif